jgi:hypothetical protein
VGPPNPGAEVEDGGIPAPFQLPCSSPELKTCCTGLREQRQAIGKCCHCPRQALPKIQRTTLTRPTWTPQSYSTSGRLTTAISCCGLPLHQAVDRRGRWVLVTQHRPDLMQVPALLHRRCRKRMSKFVRADPPQVEPRPFGGHLDRRVHHVDAEGLVGLWETAAPPTPGHPHR